MKEFLPNTHNIHIIKPFTKKNQKKKYVRNVYLFQRLNIKVVQSILRLSGVNIMEDLAQNSMSLVRILDKKFEKVLKLLYNIYVS